MIDVSQVLTKLFGPGLRWVDYEHPWKNSTLEKFIQVKKTSGQVVIKLI